MADRTCNQVYPKPKGLTWPGNLVILLSVVVFVAALSKVWAFTVDDAFITFRYARNLAEGHGLNFNADGTRAEGYTGVAWPLIMVVPHILGVDAVVASKMLGVLAEVCCGVLLFLLVTRLARRHLSPGDARLCGGFALLGLACFSGTAIHAVSGLETALFMLLTMALSFLSFLLLERPSKGLTILLSFTCLFLGLTRPEGNLLAGLVLVATWLLIDRAWRPRLLWPIWGLYVLPGALYFAWRFAYYGLPFPLPFYVKVGQSHGLRGVQDVMQFLVMISAALGGLCALGLLRLTKSLWPTLAAALALLGFYLIPDHLMGYAFRFLAPAYPLLVMLAAMGLSVLLEVVPANLSSSSARRSLARWTIVVAASLVLIAGLWQSSLHEALWARQYARDLGNAHMELARRLQAYFGSSPQAAHARVLAIADAGCVPYYSQMRTVDTFSLNDPHIVVTGRHDPDHIFAYAPDLVVVASTSEKTFKANWPRERPIYARCVAEGMRCVSKFYSPICEYWLWVMAPPDNPLARYLADLWAGSER